MRKLLLATSALAIAVTLSGRAVAELDHLAPVSATVAPPEATSGSGLIFSKDAPQATPLEAKPQVAPPSEAAPLEAKPADQATAPAQASPEQANPGQANPEQAKPAIAVEDAPVAAQLKDMVENKLHQYVPRNQDRAGVLAFYRARDFAPLWVGSGQALPRARQAADYLRGVAADGLDPADYPAPAFGNADPAHLAADDLALTNSIVTYARHASIGRVAFSRVSAAVYFDQKAPDPSEVLGKLAGAKDVGVALDAFEPQAPGYKALKARLAEVRSGKDDEPEAKAEPKEEPKAAARKKGAHQPKQAKAHAKTPKPESKEAKIDTIIANMERWRWMPHDLGAAYVMVNVPDYTLKVVQNGKTVWQTKIVVGKPGTHATPLLTETMKYITVNPTWNVPPSIIRNEYLPALAQDPNALARIGLKLSHNPDGSIRIYQPPGEKNALGRIRFNFPNRFLVYQHDTPDKNLFAKDTRAYSHGCMRVQNPDQYAEVLLGVSQPEDGYTAQRVKSLYGSAERTIPFKHPIPVYVTYQTAFVDDAGQPQSRPDIYGLDKDITNILHGDRRVADIPVPRNYSSSSKPVMASVPSARSDEGYSSFGWGSDYGSQQNWRSAYQPPDRFRVW